MMRKVYYLFVICQLVFSFVNGQNLDSLTIYLNYLSENKAFTGQIAIVKSRNIVFSRAVGHKELNSNQSINPTDLFRIGSISKTYTAALIYKIIDQGKLTEETTLDVFFPEIANARRTTIGMMLRHKSGIRSYTDQPDYLEYHTEIKDVQTIINKIQTYEPEFEPGERYKYSNSNYFLLALIAEKVMKKNYCELLDQLILKPRSLKNTLCDDDCNRSLDSFFSIGDSIFQAHRTAQQVALGAESLCATAGDVALFYQQLFDGKVLKEPSLESMTTFEANVGAGIFQVPFYNRKGYGHGGKIDAFRSFAVYFPDDGLSLAVVSNVDNDIDLNDVVVGVLSIWYGLPFALPEFHTQNFSAFDAEPYIGEYASEEIPLIIKVFFKDQKIYAQASGQPAFPLKKEEEEKMTFSQAGIVLEFKDWREGRYQGFILRQGGYTFLFNRK